MLFSKRKVSEVLRSPAILWFYPSRLRFLVSYNLSKDGPKNIAEWPLGTDSLSSSLSPLSAASKGPHSWWKVEREVKGRSTQTHPSTLSTSCVKRNRKLRSWGGMVFLFQKTHSLGSAWLLLHFSFTGSWAFPVVLEEVYDRMRPSQ